MGIINRLVKLNLITSVLLPLSIVFMEALWVYSWLVWLREWPDLDLQRTPLNLASIVILLGLSLFISQFFLKQKWSVIKVQLGIVSCGLVTIFLIVWFEYDAGFGVFNMQRFVGIGQMLLETYTGLTPIAVALVIGALVWWRGIRWGRSRLYFEDIYRSFLIGLAAIVLLVIVWGVSLGTESISVLASSTGIYIAGFFFCGLSALALGNLQAIQEKMIANKEAGRILNRRWISIILSVIVAIIVVGIGLATIFSIDVVAWLGQALSTTYDWLAKGLSYIFYGIGYLVEGLYYVVWFLVKLIQTGEPPEPFNFNMERPEGEQEQIVQGALPPIVLLVLKWTIFAIITGLVLFLLARAVRRYWSFREKDDVEEINESLWSWRGFGADLRFLFSLLRNRFKWIKRKKQAVPQRRTELADGRLSIREIYQRLLEEASWLKIPRQRNETPYEYARRFGQAIPQGGEQLEELTNLYVDVRYGEIEAEEKQIDFANRLWRALKNIFRVFEAAQSG